MMTKETVTYNSFELRKEISGGYLSLLFIGRTTLLNSLETQIKRLDRLIKIK